MYKFKGISAEVIVGSHENNTEKSRSKKKKKKINKRLAFWIKFSADILKS